MAASDFVQLMINTKGKSTLKPFTSFCDTTFSLHKSNLYLENKKMWKTHQELHSHGFGYPTVACLEDNNHLRFGSLDIVTKKMTSQRGLMVYATSSKMKKVTSKNGKSFNRFYDRYFAGVTCLGYDDKTLAIIEEMNRVEPELNLLEHYHDQKYHDDFSLGSSYEEDYGDTYQLYLPTELQEKYDCDYVFIPKEDKFEDQWIGLSSSAVNELKAFLTQQASYGAEQWLNSIDWDNMTYGNAGDKIFSSHLGLNVPSYQVGEISPTFIERLMSLESEES